jgi:hypothetical protein
VTFSCGLVSILSHPKGAKIVLAISVTLFFLSGLFSISHNGYWGLATILIAGVNAWSIGMTMPSAILVWLGQDKKKGQHRAAMTEPQRSESPRESGRES